MDIKVARNLYIYGSLFFMVIFVILSYDTLSKLSQRAPDITPQIDAGKMVWHKYNCMGCHTILGNGAYFGPDMTKVAGKKPAGYLKRFLMDPKSINPAASMPNLGITSEEADNLIAFLEWISKINTNQWPPKPILASAAAVAGRELSGGEKVYRSQGCSGCHTIQGIGGTMGPELTHVGSKRDRAWLLGHFKDPTAYVPNSAMPPITAPDADLEQLTDYMLSLK